jgi:hypothetical protein
MIIKTDKFELEISNGVDVYFGSKTSGQIFKKWEDFKEEEKLKLQMIQNSAEKLLMESEKILLIDSDRWIKEDLDTEGLS